MPVGAYIFGCSGLKLSEVEKVFFSEVNPWGFILFSRNIESRFQVQSLTSELRESVGRNIPILIDQEGGRVQRMRSPHWREFLPALEQIRVTGKNDARSMYLRSRLIAFDLREVGIDVNCIPVADILVPNTHPVLANRTYGSNVDEVVEISRSVAQGLLDGGITPVLKHIPGYGRGIVDGHEGLPYVEEGLEILRKTDFLPFKRLADLPIGMTAHVTYTAIDSLPATISKKMIKLIREDIKFKNLLITDDISMSALNGSIFKRAELSIKAGCDIVLHCNGQLDEMMDVAKACGSLNKESQKRSQLVYSKFMLSQREYFDDTDIEGLKGEFTSLMSSLSNE